MFRHYLTTAWRNILKNKGYSALNVVGLAIGMGVALLIGLWAYNEYGYDLFLPDGDRLYQVRRNFNSNGDTLNFASTSLRLATALRDEVPEIEYVAESDFGQPHALKVGDKKLLLSGNIIGSDFLNMFQFPLLQGQAAVALSNPYSIVVTEATAKALFGSADAMGKMVRFDNQHDLQVTGILRNIPVSSTFQFDYLVPFTYLDAIDTGITAQRAGSFGNNGYQLFVKLKPHVTYAQAASRIRGIEWRETKNINAMMSAVVLQPMRNWHLYGNYENGKEGAGFLQYVRLFMLIGSLVLVIACINFVNLTTARSEKRAREVGVRKAIGSERKDLIVQFLIESTMLTAMAFGLAVIFVRLALPAFNALTGDELSIPFSSAGFWLVMVLCVLVVAIAAGSRPAFYLSSFQAIKVLKAGMAAGRSATWPRKVLVVLQFSCSIALIISTIIVYQQVEHARERPVGYAIDRLLMTNANDDVLNSYTAIRNDLLEKHVVENMTTASSPATEVYGHTDIDQWPGKHPGETIEMGNMVVSAAYFKTLGMTMREGRDFQADADTSAIIFNETAIRQMRISNPLNQVITLNGMQLRIIGVVKDALAVSPFAPADPTMFRYYPQPQSILLYRLSPGISMEKALATVGAVFNKYAPAYPYTFSFEDQEYAAKFKLEVLVGKLSGVFAGLAILISCLGLFGLAAYMAEQRTKEIGIRKVLGASVTGLWLLLSKDFIVLVAISCLIASPVAYLLLDHWLNQYTYRVGIGPGVFGIACGSALLITLATISFQAIKAAVANPTRSLRSE
jgi:putative ABC transport system permease protein